MPTAPTRNTRQGTRQPRQATKARADDTPLTIKITRAVLTILGVAAMFISVIALAFTLGSGDTVKTVAACTGALFGYIVTHAAQKPWIYNLLAGLLAKYRHAPQSPTRPPTTPTPAAAKKPATTIPQQRTAAETPLPSRLPTHLPTGDLPDDSPYRLKDFTYIVRVVRELVRTGYPTPFEIMAEHWEAAGWPTIEEEDAPEYPGIYEWNIDTGNYGYRRAVTLVQGLATEYPYFQAIADEHVAAAITGCVFDPTTDTGPERLGCDPSIPLSVGLTTDNPEVFLAEIEHHSPAAAAVAALMLVRGHDLVTEDVFCQVMAPWWDAHLAYQAGHLGYRWDQEQASYVTREIAGARRDPVKIFRPADVLPDQAPVAPVSAVSRVVEAEPVDVVDVPLGDPAPRRPERPHRTPAPAPAPAPVPVPAPVSEVRAVGGADEFDLDDAGDYGFTVNEIGRAARLLVESGFGSTKMLERKLNIGFGAAGSIMDQLEFYRIVGPRKDAGGARDVNPDRDHLDDAVEYVRECEVARRLADAEEESAG